jgi:hypothetical protein
VNTRFACPGCDAPAYAKQPGATEWRCPSCDHAVVLSPAAEGKPLAGCVVCGNHELYRKKDFPHGLGMALLVLACLATVITYWLYHQWLTWGILIGTALFDALLYFWVGDVVVCYRCGAQFRGHVPNPEHGPHELTIAERYRQERIRREQLQFGRERAASADPERSPDARG